MVYEVSDEPVMAGSESALDVRVAYATSGAINLRDAIDNLDGDEIFVVSLFATPPDGSMIDLATGKSCLEGAQLGFTKPPS